MRNLVKFISAAGLAMALAVSAQATPYVGGASFALSTLPGLVASGSGTGTSAAGLVTIVWTNGGSAGPTFITLAPTAAAPLSALNIVVTAPSGVFTGTPLAGAAALGGTANAFVAGAPFLIVPFTETVTGPKPGFGNSAAVCQQGGIAPCGIGLGGRLSFGAYASYIDANTWSTGAVPLTINGVTLTTGNVTTPGVPIFMTGSDNRDGAGLGTVTLVSPAGLMSSLGGAFPLFVSMTLTFVPEPGTLLLLGSGIAGLAIIGRKRMSR
jgi:hypothetical protein